MARAQQCSRWWLCLQVAKCWHSSLPDPKPRCAAASRTHGANQALLPCIPTTRCFENHKTKRRLFWDSHGNGNIWCAFSITPCPKSGCFGPIPNGFGYSQGAATPAPPEAVTPTRMEPLSTIQPHSPVVITIVALFSTHRGCWSRLDVTHTSLEPRAGSLTAAAVGHALPIN